MKKLNMNSASNGSIFLGFILAILLLSVNGWGACRPVSSEWNYREGCNSISVQYLCTNTLSATICGRDCNFYSGYSGGYCTNMTISLKPGVSCGDYNQTISFVGTICDTQREADSTGCVMQGNVWQNDSCKINNCKAADTTWLTSSIASCSGENNYAIINTDSTCEHVGTCCDGLDSIPEGNSCKWRCDSVLTVCNGRTGQLLGGVLPDTVSSLSDTVVVNKCYYNCAHSPNADSSVYLVEGNIVLGGPNDSIPDGIKSQSTFNSVRTETGGVYVYDYLTPAASEYIDSIAAMKCVEHLWRCVINSKYVYWYDNQEVPAGCTNIVRVK